ncbi:hemojuvelin [Amia ocellicauda]|uniref:hemojuvelin n=1 Tax=Amia ocellicauda TaxID=2972642 RepID=UPI003464A95F
MWGPGVCWNGVQLPGRRALVLAWLISQLCSAPAWAQCRILRCNSEFVAAAQDYGGGGEGGAGEREGSHQHTGYCSALRSYAQCTRRTARACRGDLAFHSAVQGIEDLLIQHRCPKAGPGAPPRPPPRPRPAQAPLPGEACSYERAYLQREGRPPRFLHCGVFGDPHVRTFRDEFQTCAVPGAWPLIDNEHLYVQATSAPARPGSPPTADALTSATVLTKITIIFKGSRECVDQQIYQAELGDVPAAFVDGSVSAGGERRGGGGLAVRSLAPGRHAEIVAAHIGATLVVRQTGHFLSLAVRAPEDVVGAFSPEQDLQLCVWGCPASQRLDPPNPHPHPAPALSNSFSLSAARSHCARLLPTEDVYFQACVFDLLATGDANSSSAALAALEDARALLSDTERLHLLPNHAPASAGRPLLLLLALLAQQLLAGLLQDVGHFAR